MSAVLLLFALGLVGWQILRVTGISNASLLGTVLLVGALRAFGVQLPNTPPLFSDGLQVTLGFLVGSMLTRETLRNMRKYLSPTVLTAFWICGFALSAGLFLSRLTSLDPLTAMLAASPGGLPEMTVIAVDTNADVTIVILIHVFRIFLVMGCFPFVVPYFLAKSHTTGDVAIIPEEGLTVAAPDHRLRSTAISGLMAAAGGAIFKYSCRRDGGCVSGHDNSDIYRVWSAYFVPTLARSSSDWGRNLGFRQHYTSSCPDAFFPRTSGTPCPINRAYLW